MSNSYPLNGFEPGTEAYVKGTVEFSRVASHISGDELIRDQNWRRERGTNPVQNPYTRISLIDPEIVPSQSGKSQFDIHLEQDRFWRATKDNKLRFTAENKNPNNLPLASHQHIVDGTPTLEAITLERELAAGSTVLVKMRVFKSKNQMNHGMAMEAIVILDPEIKYYNSNSGVQGVADGLAARGIAVQAVQNKTEPEADTDCQNDDLPFGDGQPEYKPNNYDVSAPKAAGTAGIVDPTINPSVTYAAAVPGIAMPV